MDLLKHQFLQLGKWLKCFFKWGQYGKNYNSYCALWAYVSCHVYFSVLFQKELSKKCKHCSTLFLTVGNWRWLHLPTAALPGCGFGYTQAWNLEVCLYIDKSLERFLCHTDRCWCGGTLVQETHLCQTHSCLEIVEIRGGKTRKKRERVGWEKKTEPPT